MAHFYAEVKGKAKTHTSRLGTLQSGVTALATGWDIGGRIQMRYDNQLKTDVVDFYLTNGSNGFRSNRVLSIAIIDNKPTILQTNYPELLI